MIEKVLETIKEYELIENGEKVIVGVSGGPDSVCLLHILHTLSKELSIELFVVHVNHMLRGEEASKDEGYVDSLCTRLGIPFHSVSCDIRKLSEDRGISLEEAGRDARYHQFNLFAKKIKAHKIAVAHNKNDQSETVLMNIIRGSGLAGLKGIEFKRGIIIRPLLNISRNEIEDYCSNNGLIPRIDKSNEDNIYTRNKIRLDLIPYIEELFGTDIVSNVYRMSELLKKDNDFIDIVSQKDFDKACREREKGRVTLDLKKLCSLHPALQGRVVRLAYKEVSGDLKNLENVHVDSVIKLAITGRTGAQIDLPKGVRAEKGYGVLIVTNRAYEEKPDFFSEAIKVPGTTLINGGEIVVEAILEKRVKTVDEYTKVLYNSPIQFFDYDLLKQGINIRYRRDGDVFKPFKSTGTKKLKEFFIDKKVPRAKRDHIPLVAKENDIVWIIGYKISDKYKITENTKNILILRYNTDINNNKQNAD